VDYIWYKLYFEKNSKYFTITTRKSILFAITQETSKQCTYFFLR